jgi:hypothetical protein
MLLVLAVYSGLISMPLLLVGSFVGPTILAGGLVHATLFFILLLARRAIDRQMHWPKRALIVLSLLGAIALPVAIGQGAWTSAESGADLLFPLIISLMSAALFVLTLCSLRTHRSASP